MWPIIPGEEGEFGHERNEPGAPPFGRAQRIYNVIDSRQMYLQALLSQAIAPQLQHALESMPKELRDAVWLRDVEEHSYAEIAQRLRIPAGTVMSRISRGRRLLHDRLLELEGGKTAL